MFGKDPITTISNLSTGLYDHELKRWAKANPRFIKLLK